ncbi:hypothetical protein, partial [Streptomyces alkaliphilus]|uniref:hypothetical protein n=1 Tax=Streptomyces alkaliphilus TaxID=1472722 RepID=UPI0015F9D040
SRPTDPRALAREILTAAGATGYTPKELHAALGEALGERGEEELLPAPRTVAGWLTKWEGEGTAAADRTGQYTVYTIATDKESTK